MKKITAIICMLLTAQATVFAQKPKPFNYDYEIIYQYTFKPNKADTTRLSEPTVLFCTDKEFYYVSVKNYQKSYEIANGGGEALVAQAWSGAYKPTDVTHYIFSNENDITTLERAHTRSFSYQEKPELKWEIQKDTMTIKGYSCQKALLAYGGRQWLAWFAADIPLGMGPYKFNGLPGLILRVSDSQEEFQWELSSFNKVKTAIPWAYFYKTKLHEYVTKKEYFDYRIKRLEDPFTYDMLLNPAKHGFRSPNMDVVHRLFNKRAKSKLFEDNFIEIE